MDSIEDKKDLWLAYELAPGRTMNELLFDVRGEFFKGERIYMVNHSNFYHCLRNDLELLKEYLFRMSCALSLFARLGIVHGDLKPENILIEYDEDKSQITNLKIIDFGSAFILNVDGSRL